MEYFTIQTSRTCLILFLNMMVPLSHTLPTAGDGGGGAEDRGIPATLNPTGVATTSSLLRNTIS